jgi:nitrite reductase/ring-hydroxylating ferredoxin subunit
MQQVCALSDLSEGEVLKILVEGFKPLAATLLEGVPYVFPDTCPHAEESLSEGWVEDGRVVCGVHFAEFGLANDEVVNRPVGCGHLRKYPAELREDAVFADLTDAEVA